MKPSTNQPSVNRIGPATAPSATHPAAGLADRIAMVAIGFLLSVTIGISSRFRQAHLKADPFGSDGAGLERTLRGEALEPCRRVGATLEHLERPLRREGAHPAQVHPLDLALDGGMRWVAAHVLDHGRP